MKTFLSTQWERLSSSYWFIPTVMSFLATGLSFLTVHIDTLINAKWARAAGWIWAGGPEGARSVLSTIAGSTITVAGVVFSITIVTLSLASSQFGPRLLRNFMNDRATQFVLGVFVATFLYSLLILRTIRGTDANSFVPFLSVTSGILFAVASVGFLIFFIHHVPHSILAENLIGRVADELQLRIERLYPDKLEEGRRERKSDIESQLPAGFAEEAQPLESKNSGFIQAIDKERLLELATREEVVLRLCRRSGDFVAEETALALVWPADKLTEEFEKKCFDAFFFGSHRTPNQDIEYAIDQLVEVAVRALSPGINDPFTAMSCIEWLGVALISVGRRQIPSALHYDGERHLRLVTDVIDYSGIAAAALNQIRQYGCASVGVVIRLLDMIARVALELERTEDRQVLIDHAAAIREDGLREAKNERDKSDIETMYLQAQKALTEEDR
ncbi:MAG: DUF2254 domain-containing protein [Chthoniobacterales bacterium]|nr:DUF2254 domain-containing protein [Chthoniobacterales bacterium]